MGSSGSSGSSGGGSSGAVDYPAYMKSMHSAWLTAMDSIVWDYDAETGERISNFTGTNNPYNGLVYNDPSTNIASMNNNIAAIKTAFTNWDVHFSTDQLNAASDITDKALETTESAAITGIRDIVDLTLDGARGKFHAGMRDIGAVMSSAFVIGKAVIETSLDAEVTKAAQILVSDQVRGRAQTYTQVLQFLTERERLWINFQEAYAQNSAAQYTAMQEMYAKYVDDSAEVSKLEAIFPLEVQNYLNNTMASIAGGTTSGVSAKTPSRAQAAIGGAMSGAAMGGMVAGASNGAISGPWGMAAGAVIGLGASFL